MNDVRHCGSNDFEAFGRRLSESLNGNQEKATDVTEGILQLIRPACNVEPPPVLRLTPPVRKMGGKLRPVPYVVPSSETLLGDTGWLSATVLHGIQRAQFGERCSYHIRRFGANSGPQRMCLTSFRNCRDIPQI